MCWQVTFDRAAELVGKGLDQFWPRCGPLLHAQGPANLFLRAPTAMAHNGGYQPMSTSEREDTLYSVPSTTRPLTASERFSEVILAQD